MPAGPNSRANVLSPSVLMATLSTGGPPIFTRSRGRANSCWQSAYSQSSVWRRSRLASAVSVTMAAALSVICLTDEQAGQTAQVPLPR